VTNDRDRVVAALAQPSYTPGRRDLAIVAAVIAEADEALGTKAVKGLVRAEPEPALAAVDAELARSLARSDDAGAARLVASIGQLARRPHLPSAARLITIADDDAAAPRARRAAVVALGKVGGDEARDALRRFAARADLLPEQRRAVVEALGKVGGAEDTIAGIAGADDDPELRRRRDRALLMSERDRGREQASTIRGDAVLADEVIVVARCRSGLEELLGAELEAAGIPVTEARRAEVRVHTRGPLAAFHAARTWLTIGIERPIAEPSAEAIAAAVIEAQPLLTALTDGAIRWRLDFAGGGHRRAVVWQAAQRVRAAAPALINDPTSTTWDVVVYETSLELRPRRLDDPRFAWRVADVSAASHPTIAAALARIAGVQDGDVVWDPFCGSGSELIERARLGHAHLIGSDLDARALEAARANLAAAGLTAELTLGDALAFDPGPVSLIISNPPLGRRIRGDAGALLERFVARAARLLVPGGRLVWITPAVGRTERAARDAGLTLDHRRTVDLGGYDAHLERWIR